MISTRWLNPELQRKRKPRAMKLRIMESDAVKAAAVEVRNELKAFDMLRQRLKP